MPDAGDKHTSLQEVMNALADSGRCGDLWDIQTELVARGHSGADVNKAAADADYRSALEARCSNAQRNMRHDTAELIVQQGEPQTLGPSPLLDDERPLQMIKV